MMPAAPRISAGAAISWRAMIPILGYEIRTPKKVSDGSLNSAPPT